MLTTSKTKVTLSEAKRDTGRRRWVNAYRPYMAALRRFPDYGRLWFYTVALDLADGVGLYSEQASAAARSLTESLCGPHPARWKLERGCGGGLHVHIVTVLPPVAMARYDDVQSVYDLRRLLAYLAKPAEAALCREKSYTHYRDESERRRAVIAAIDEQAAARAERLRSGKRRLPPCQGWTGRRVSPDQTTPAPAPSLVLGLWLLLFAFLLAVSAPAVEARHINTLRRIPRRSRGYQRRPRPPERSLSGSRL